MRRSGPLLLQALNCVGVTRQGVTLSYLKRYDAVVYTQKLAPCLLLYSGWNAYACALFTFAHCSVVLMVWLRLRPHHRTGSRNTALLLFTCVLGLQTYMVVDAARMVDVVARGPVAPWHHAFNIAVFCYVFGVTAFCLACAVWDGVRLMRGPVTKPRRAAVMRKSDQNYGLWVSVLGSFASSRGAGSGGDTVHYHSAKPHALTRRLRVATAGASVMTPTDAMLRNAKPTVTWQPAADSKSTT